MRAYQNVVVASILGSCRTTLLEIYFIAPLARDDDMPSEKRSIPITKEPELAIVGSGSARVFYSHNHAINYSLKF